MKENAPKTVLVYTSIGIIILLACSLILIVFKANGAQSEMNQSIDEQGTVQPESRQQSIEKSTVPPEHISEREINFNVEHDFAGVVISSGANFEVYDITKDNQPEYRYVIYNLDGEAVEKRTVWRTPPHITYTNDDSLLSIFMGVGTGTFYVQYYDITRDLFSDIFYSVLLEGYGKIAYINVSNGRYELEIRDIFDESVFFQRVELDFSPIANPVEGVRYIAFCGEDTITIRYLAGAGYDEKTEKIILRSGDDVNEAMIPTSTDFDDSQIQDIDNSVMRIFDRLGSYEYRNEELFYEGFLSICDSETYRDYYDGDSLLCREGNEYYDKIEGIVGYSLYYDEDGSLVFAEILQYRHQSYCIYFCNGAVIRLTVGIHWSKEESGTKGDGGVDVLDENMLNAIGLCLDNAYD